MKLPTKIYTTVKKGFTLIELVMVIIILGIIASVSLPKFANFKTTAIEKSEDAIFGAINSAIKIYQASYIVAGGDPYSYPAVNPFDLLAQAPSNYTTGTFANNTQDNVRWRALHNTVYTAYYFYCPHWNGGVYNDASKGRQNIYLYGTNPYSPWTLTVPHKAGDVWTQFSYSH